MARRITLDFLKTEQASGALLAIAVLAAVLMANSPWSGRYFDFIGQALTIQIGAFRETQSVLVWVKEGLMAIFFFVVGMEIKHEVLRGELANPRRLALPVAAALGGVLVPAAVYSAFNLGPGGAVHGWPIATGTDVAFALAALAAVGRRLPSSLRVFLLTLAIVDDLAAVAMIALLFTAKIKLGALAGAGASFALMIALSRWRGAPYLFYAACFALVWAFTLKSGLSTSVAGAACALAVPIGPRKPGQGDVLQYFMDSLHGYVAFLILPLFAFCASGFALDELTGGAAVSPVAMGVAAGLLLGKPAGILGGAGLAVGLKVARRPTGARWIELFGVALLCGAGLTMSLFIGGLAFAGDPAGETRMRVGVIVGSLLSVGCGMAVLAWAGRHRAAP